MNTPASPSPLRCAPLVKTFLSPNNSMFHKMFFIIVIPLLSSNYIYASVANDTCTLTSEDVSMFKRHLIALKKWELIESISSNYYPDNSLIFYFAPYFGRKGGTLLVLDSNNFVIEGFQIQPCCDSTVFNSKEILKRKTLRKLDKINRVISLNSNDFYSCLLGYDSRFETLVFVKNGKLQSGVIIGDRSPNSNSQNYLIRLRKLIRSSNF